MAIGVLFVCTGNICRSPMAAGVFRTLVERAGMAHDFVIDSAGTFDGQVGKPASPLAIETAQAARLRHHRPSRQAADRQTW